jgi:hypothetical protein
MVFLRLLFALYPQKCHPFPACVNTTHADLAHTVLPSTPYTAARHTLRLALLNGRDRTTARCPHKRILVGSHDHDIHPVRTQSLDTTVPLVERNRTFNGWLREISPRILVERNTAAMTQDTYQPCFKYVV